MSNRIYTTLGTVAMTPKGEYNSSAYYEYLDIVLYNGLSYIAKKNSNNVLPTNSEYWQLFSTPVYLSGSTSNRPSTNLNVGLSYFDTTLGKPIWYDGTNWVDATGTQV